MILEITNSRDNYSLLQHQTIITHNANCNFINKATV